MSCHKYKYVDKYKIYCSSYIFFKIIFIITIHTLQNVSTLLYLKHSSHAPLDGAVLPTTCLAVLVCPNAKQETLQYI